MNQQEKPVKRLWILQPAVVLLFVTLLNYVAWGLRPEPLYLVYANATLLGVLWLGGTCFIIPITILAIGWFIIRDFLRTRYVRTGQMISLALAIIAGVIMFFSMLAFRDDLYWHRAGVVFGDHVYYVASHNKYPDLGFGRYEVFECDSLGIVCTPVFETEWGIDTGGQASIYVIEGKLEISVDGWLEDKKYYYMP